MHIVIYSPESWSVPDTLFDSVNNTVIRVTGPLDDVADAVASNPADMLVLQGFEQDALLVAKIGQICRQSPGLAVIPICIAPSPEFLLQLMRTGVREVLTSETSTAIKETLDRVSSAIKAASPVAVAPKHACTIALISAKGGDGATCLAANLAVMLSESPANRVLAIDLSLPFGDLDIYMTGERAAHNLAKFSQEVQRLDRALLDSMVHHVSARLDLIPSPTLFEDSFRVNPANIKRLVKLAATYYQFIVLDLGTQAGPFAMNFLDAIDDLVLVTSPSMASIRHAGQILRLLDGLGFDAKRVGLVLNRYSEQGELDAEQIRQAVGKEIRHTLPGDAKTIDEAILRGVSLVQNSPRSKLARAISNWSKDWLGETHDKRRSIWRLLKIR